ncbi:acyl-CoA thioesterase [Natronorubrum halophilum]|uniref:acyl-CoA thioesterase n=1 Tax=Natronorubrum halophilum TaxID=1702106 RepID=UPI0010C1A08D|nr:thioesterase family protein [Natronorubrum halophilum]
MPHTTEITVDWGDTDAGGLIYYPRFFHFVIVGVNEYFAAATDGEHPMESYRRDGYLFPAVEASASFHSPLRAGATATLETTVVDSGTASLTIAFAISRVSNGERVADGEVSFVFVDGAFESVPLPPEIHDCIRDRGDARD